MYLFYKPPYRFLNIIKYFGLKKCFQIYSLTLYEYNIMPKMTKLSLMLASAILLSLVHCYSQHSLLKDSLQDKNGKDFLKINVFMNFIKK